MTLAVEGAVMGRPATTVAGLSRQLERARQENADLRLELLIQRDESLAFAERVRTGVDRIIRASTAGSDMAVVNEAGALGYRATRRIAQLGSVL
jgi:hypothetical protein